MIYLASAYSSPDAFIEERRYKQVAALTAKLLRRNVHVYSPIVSCHNLAREFKLPSDAAWWAWYNHGMLDLSTELWVLVAEGVTESRGVKKEIEYAEEKKIPIRYINDSGDDVPSP